MPHLQDEMVKSATRKKRSVTDAAAYNALLAAGEKLFALHPYDEVSIDDIAGEANVAHGLLFHYFKNKLEFYSVVYSRFLESLHERRVAATMTGTPEQRLRSFIEVHLALFEGRLDDHISHIRGGVHAKIAAIAEESRLQGVKLILSFFSNQAPTPIQMLLCRSWLGFADEIIVEWLQNPTFSRTAILDTCIEIYFETMARIVKFSPVESVTVAA